MNAAEFLNGISLATFAASGVFFLKFWKVSRDRFFLLFSLAFCCLAFERFALFLFHDAQLPIRNGLTESNSWVYLLRLMAFGLILSAIIDRNRRSGSGHKL